MCSGLHSATVVTFSTGTLLTTGTLASSLLYSHPDVSICHPAVRVRQLQRGPLPWIVHPYMEKYHNAITRRTALPPPHARHPELGQPLRPPLAPQTTMRPPHHLHYLTHVHW
jgi:hypothetical protein